MSLSVCGKCANRGGKKCLTGWLNYSPKVSGPALLSETENLFFLAVGWSRTPWWPSVWTDPLQKGRFHCTGTESVALCLTNTQGMAYRAMAELWVRASQALRVATLNLFTDMQCVFTLQALSMLAKQRPLCYYFKNILILLRLHLQTLLIKRTCPFLHSAGIGAAEQGVRKVAAVLSQRQRDAACCCSGFLTS